jgi:hypothetical protein
MTIKSAQLRRLGELLLRKRGVTAMEAGLGIGSTCPHKRMSDLKARGWTITRNDIEGRRDGRFFGRAPK